MTRDEALKCLRELETAPADELFEDSYGSYPRPNEEAIGRARAFLPTADGEVVDVDTDDLGGIVIYVRDAAGLLTWYSFTNNGRDTLVLLNGPKDCRTCGRPVEESRRVYAIPTCYACLPPPEPLPIAKLRGQ
jgi:hypothetical protein